MVDVKELEPTLFQDVGATGRVANGHWYDDEYLPELRWPRQAPRVYREMLNDPIVGSIQRATDLLARRVDWKVDPADDTPQAAEVADLCASALHDLTEPWTDTLSGMLSFAPYGFAVNAINFKRREGPNGKIPSNHNDGKIGFKNLPPRSQDTIVDFHQNEQGDWDYATQQGLGVGSAQLPLARCLHIRTTASSGNPWGTAFLRTAYEPWFRRKMIKAVEAIGIERDLAGFPVVGVPSRVLAATAGQDLIIKNAMIDLATKARRNEAEGALIPLEYDENGNRLYEFTLLTTGGRRQFDTSQVITRYSQEILGTALADFLAFGQQGSSTGLGFGFGTTKYGMFLDTLDVLNGQVAGEVTAKGFRLLTVLNGWPAELTPSLVAGSAQQIDVGTIADTLVKVAQAGGAPFPDTALFTWLCTALGVPHEQTDTTDI